MRTRDPEGKREALLSAGMTLADKHGLGLMSINQVVAAAGAAKGTFFHHFGDRAGFLVALHRRFHDRLFTQVTAATVGLPVGRPRLRAGTTAYLDGCLRERGIRALLIEARAEQAILSEVALRNDQFTALAAPDFADLGHRDASASARLWVVLVAEVAVAESASGGIRTDLRGALVDFLLVGGQGAQLVRSDL